MNNEETGQPAGQDAKEGCNKKQWCDERQRHWQMGSGGVRIGDATTFQNRGTRGTRGDGTLRGASTTRGRGSSRWEAAA